ncbi:4-hydroxy-tetrahydrodipicolinate reductase [Dethiosulfovibrio salsuginis]|uniref:4-hydroxy-tetrahydrodipicolinate reductase n=1 Tax=Dethiosulfovibrio salsuginis TaxID=561720 RepID=A0A1X7IGP3_9BACT|nr:dihydrodipicolinate reductase C-terminal domain-containing protein [Dethiosulfovibrio salsuginis]SMG13699.1 dihydrodipicolinate reductase [Dethiosulfovibrio salsuginis]
MKYGIVGSSGRMGRELIEVFGPENCVATISLEDETILDSPEVIVDFSRPEALKRTLEVCREYRSALVLGTTALTEDHMVQVKELAQSVAVVQGYNFSVGIGVLRMILRQYAPALSEWDVEISETHHIHKVDAPSGTAITLKKEVGRDCPTHSLRMGGVPGDHSVSFANEGEVLTLTHRAISRKVFAMGALQAARFAIGQQPGLYDFEEVVSCALKR